MTELMKELLKQKEHNRLEVKRAREAVPQSLWETYSSFANTLGGTILLGVDEQANGELAVTGVPDSRRYIQTLWNTLNNRQKISHNILVQQNIRVEEIEGKHVIIIDVPRANRTNRPVYINDNVFTGSYRRDGEGDYHCSEEEVRLMIRDSSAGPTDLVILDSLDLDALCSDTIQKYRQRLSTVKPELSWNQLSDEALLYRLNAIGRSDRNSEFHPTAAGLLMFGYHHEIVKEFPHYLLDYREVVDEKTRWIDRVVSDAGTWSGNLFDFYFLVANKLTVNIKTPFALDKNMVRIDDTAVHAAVREALINTLIHANYYERRGLSIIKTNTSFRFSNPGSLRIEPEVAIDGGLSDPRNSTLFTMFTLINIGERAGSGLSNIFAVWKQKQWDTPSLSETFNPERTVLELSMRKSGDIKSGDIESGDIKSGDIKESSIQYRASTNLQRQRILEFLQTNETSTNAEICTLLDIKSSRARTLLSQMVNDGLLIAEGDRKGRIYRIKNT